MRGKLFSAIVLSAASACGEARQTGGITARLRFEDTPEAAVGTKTGTLRQALRPEMPPSEIFRLQITCLSAEGSTLAQAILSKRPNLLAGELLLNPAGGRWTLEGVRVGTKRTLVARGYFPDVVGDPTLSGVLAF